MIHTLGISYLNYRHRPSKVYVGKRIANALPAQCAWGSSSNGLENKCLGDWLLQHWKPHQLHHSKICTQHYVHGDITLYGLKPEFFCASRDASLGTRRYSSNKCCGTQLPIGAHVLVFVRLYTALISSRLHKLWVSTCSRSNKIPNKS